MESRPRGRRRQREVGNPVALFRKTFPGKDCWTTDLSTTLLRSSGRDDKGEGGASIECGCRTENYFSSPWVGRRPMTPPGEMTKGRAALPLSVVVEQRLFFITLGRPKAHDSSGQDDKGEGGASIECGCVEQRLFFITLGGPKAHDSSGQDDKGEGGCGPEFCRENADRSSCRQF
jgi:hypothetical protein